MKQFIKKRNEIFVVSEGIFDFIKAIITGKVDVAEIDDEDLSKGGKDLKKAIKNMEKRVEKEANKKGMSVDQLIKSKGYTF